MHWIMTHIKEFCIWFVAVVGSYFLPLVPTMLTVGLLIAVDTIYAVFVASKLGEKITSRKMSEVLSKMLLYQLIIITIYVIERNILGQYDLFACKAAAMAITWTELKSIDESFQKMFGYSIWTKLRKSFSRGDSNTK